MSRKTSIALMVIQFIPLLLIPPSTIQADSQVLTIPVFLVLLAAIATAALAMGNRTAWPRTMLIFAQGINVVIRLMMLVSQAVSAGRLDALFVLASLLAIGTSGTVLYMLDQFQLDLRSI
jgi:hypothetical protein